MRRTILRLSAAALCVGLWQPGAWAGPFVNGNFADFSGWNGAIRASATDVLTDVAPAADAHFFVPVVGGFARLQNDAAFYEVDLFQAFDLDPTAQTLSFDYAWSLTVSDPVTDFVQAILWLADRSAWIDLFPVGVDTSARPTTAARPPMFAPTPASRCCSSSCCRMATSTRRICLRSAMSRSVAWRRCRCRRPWPSCSRAWGCCESVVSAIPPLTTSLLPFSAQDGQRGGQSRALSILVPRSLRMGIALALPIRPD